MDSDDSEPHYDHERMIRIMCSESDDLIAFATSVLADCNATLSRFGTKYERVEAA